MPASVRALRHILTHRYPLVAVNLMQCELLMHRGAIRISSSNARGVLRLVEPRE